MIHQLIEDVLPFVISIIELIGILVVLVTAVHAFWHYICNTFLRKEFEIQYDLATGLATALEFKMAAEILKTVLVREMSELLILGAIIVLRALLSLLIHFELRHAKKDDKTIKPDAQ